MANWIQHTSKGCMKWMHDNCVSKNSKDKLVCVCGSEYLGIEMYA